MPQLRRVSESDSMKAVPLYDPFVLLVDGKQQSTDEHFANSGKIAAGLYHPFSGATRFMLSKEATLQEGDGPCGSVADPNPGQIQMAAEHLAISMGAEFFCKNRDFCVAAHAKYCADGKLPEYTIISDTTTWFGAVERYFRDPREDTLRGEYKSLRSLVAHLERLAMRASAVNVYHKYTEPLWGDTEAKKWPPDIVATSGMKHDDMTSFNYCEPSYAWNFVCQQTIETGWAQNDKRAKMHVGFKIICRDHEDANQRLHHCSLAQALNHPWQDCQHMAYFDTSGTRVDHNCRSHTGVQSVVVCSVCHRDHSLQLSNFRRLFCDQLFCDHLLQCST